jgi:hypothetical protein
MTSYRQVAEGALGAVAIRGRTSFSWFGVPAGDLPAHTESAMSPADARAYLLYQLQTRLYGDFYTQGEAKPSLSDGHVMPPLGPSPFVQALSEANHGTGSLESGWTIVAEDADRLVVERGGLRLWSQPSGVAAANGAPLQPGAAVAVLMPKELLRLSPGYYMALGNRELPTDGSGTIVRFYWDLRSEGAVGLVELLTRSLNDAGHAFRLKVVSDPASYTRCDAGVLYTLASEYEAVAEIVARIYGDVAPVLNAATPAFAKTLAPGLALAEDPSGGMESFGQNRCQLLAEAMIEAAERGLQSLPERLEVVAERFRAAGLDLDQPYLNSGSTDRYAWPA